MDVTGENHQGHSPCFYADFTNHHQCVAFLMVVQTCVDLAKSMILLQRAAEASRSHDRSPDGESSSSDEELEKIAEDLSSQAWQIIR